MPLPSFGLVIRPRWRRSWPCAPTPGCPSSRKGETPTWSAGAGVTLQQVADADPGLDLGILIAPAGAAPPSAERWRPTPAERWRPTLAGCASCTSAGAPHRIVGCYRRDHAVFDPRWWEASAVRQRLPGRLGAGQLLL